MRYENEKEEERLAAITGAALTQQIGPLLGAKSNLEITQANFRDQGF